MNCTGRLPSKHDDRTLRLAQFKTARQLAHPTVRLWQTPVHDWGVMGNHQYGNCVIATAAHAKLSIRANELADTRRISDAAVIDLSRQMGALMGYNILDRLKYWRNTGMWASKIWAFAATNPKNHSESQDVINTFGWLDIGINLPYAWKNASVWDVGNGRNYAGGSWGGHSIPAVGYDEKYYYVVTWGEVLRLTYAAMERYVDETYAVIDPDWLAKDATTPAGYDLPAIAAELNALAA